MGLFGVLSLLIPWVDANLGGFVAVVFLYLPAWVIRRRGQDLEDYGLSTQRLGRDVAVFLALTAVVFPLYLVGHWAFHTQVLHRQLAVGADTFRRFDRDLELRPEQPSPGRLAVWVDNDWLRVESADAEFRVVVSTDAAAPRAARTGAGRGATSEGDGVAARVSAASGPLLVDLHGHETLRIRAEPGPLSLGQYGVAAEAPLETSRSSFWWLWLFGLQVLMVALPEEWFYRGYLQAQLEASWPAPQWRILGASLGWGWLLGSALFALGHLVLDPRPARLLVFFPSLLFGWMRARTGSVIPGALFHAACNVLATALSYAYVG